MRSLWNLVTTSTGFRSEGVLIASVIMRPSDYPIERRPAVRAQVLDGLRATAGVTGVAEVAFVPFSGGFGPRVSAYRGDSWQTVSFNQVGPDYFRVMGMPLVAGRDLTDQDTLTSVPVAIVTERFRSHVLHGANPIGRRIYREGSPGEPEGLYQIVGLVGDSKMRSLREDVAPGVFLPAAQIRRLRRPFAS